MDISISKRVITLFGLLCVSALFWPNVALAEPVETNGNADVYILPFEYMDAILIESDGHFDGYRIGPDGKWIS